MNALPHARHIDSEFKRKRDDVYSDESQRIWVYPITRLMAEKDADFSLDLVKEAYQITSSRSKLALVRINSPMYDFSEERQDFPSPGDRAHIKSNSKITQGMDVRVMQILTELTLNKCVALVEFIVID